MVYEVPLTEGKNVVTIEATAATGAGVTKAVTILLERCCLCGDGKEACYFAKRERRITKDGWKTVMVDAVPFFLGVCDSIT